MSWGVSWGYFEEYIATYFKNAVVQVSIDVIVFECFERTILNLSLESICKA